MTDASIPGHYYFFVPVGISAFVLLTAGAPRRGGWEVWWTFLNIVVVHPMDFFVGALGIGPKFLLDEFAMLDSRWPEKDNTVMWVCYMGFFTMVPLCYMWYRSAVRGHWSKHFWAVLCSAFQQLGTFIYMGSEWGDGFIHLPACDWPPRFDTYLKLKYFWFVFWFLNGLWIVIPLFVYYRAYKHLGALSEKTKQH